MAEPPNIFQFKVTLLGTDPPIWRRLLVPADLTLEQLHETLQVAMGWQNCHLHEFHIGKQRYGAPDPFGAGFGGPRTLSARATRLSGVFGRVGAEALYIYDFGDSWEHAIVIEKKLEPEPGRIYPARVSGERNGPPEDCGGLPGFYNLLDALSDPSHKDHEELREWVGDDYDPNAFSVDEVNQRLDSRQRRRARATARKSSKSGA